MENVHIEQLKYFSMFSGIGGFELGIQQAYEDNIEYESEESKKTYGKNGGKRTANKLERSFLPTNNPVLCIGYSEIDKYAIQIYEKHFKHKNYGDATKIDTKELPDFDFLVGGFPCQAFSIAGKRKGFDDTRGTLFFDIARILKDKRPRYFLLENVKGLLSHEQGKTFQTILGVLTNLGYGVEWQVLNSKNFGVPQNRERVFIVGHLGGEPRPKVFPIGGQSKETDGGNKDISSTLDSNYWKGPSLGFGGKGRQMVADYRSDEELRIRKEPINPTLTARKYSKTDPSTMPPLMINLHQKRTGEYGNGEKQLNESSFTLDSGSGHDLTIASKSKIRRLTPTECERLQGFPDGWTEGVSDTQRYKCLGNAVTVNVIKAIFKKYREIIKVKL